MSLLKSYTKKCNNCDIDYISHYSSNYCSELCKKKFQYEAIKKKKILNSLVKYPEGTDVNAFVSCAICGFRSADLSTHTSVHNITIAEYVIEYGPTKCINTKNLMVGNKNPGYKHGGTLSPFSKNFVHYVDDSSIESLLQQAQKSRNDNHNNCTRIDYYLHRGYSQIDAEEALSNRQSTFSLKICIEKYGIEEGATIWEDRQDRWQFSLNDKSQYEMNKKKSSKVNYKTLWSGNLDLDGYFYAIKLGDNTCKIGVTTKDSITKRYSKKEISNKEVLLFEKADSINHAFQIEQILKNNNISSIIKKDYGAFGWTEVINDINIKSIIDLASIMLLNPLETNNQFKLIYNA